MIMDTHVTFTQAKQLRRFGFKDECDYHYVDNRDTLGLINLINTHEFYHLTGVKLDNDSVPAPTLTQAQRWLREKKSIDVYVVPVKLNQKYEYWLMFERRGYGGNEDYGVEDTYEKALTSGINEAIKFLKNERRK